VDHLTPDVLDQLQRALEPQYRLDGELGRGGMGVVYRAIDTTLDRPVAVKVIHPELAAHEAIARRFLAEARMIARLRHPNVVAVYAAGSAGSLLYYVMDLVPGESLRQRLTRDRRLPAAEVVHIVSDLASALDAAARAGIVHRDVKPENVLIESTTGRALLADFGIARAVAAEEMGHSTGQGVAVGTPTYMSPEQSAGEEVDSRSDLYSLGVVGYEMLAGHPPFQGPNRVVVSKHIAERPVPIEKIRSDCPPSLSNAIMRALEKHPAARWQTGQAMRDALTATAPVAPARRVRRFAVMSALAAVLVAGATVTLAGRRDGPPRGVNPRHSILVLPFDNLRRDPAMEWMRDGSVSMLALNLSQWNDLQVVDHERLHDLLAKYQVDDSRPIGLYLARRLAREAGVWTVALGEFERAGDSLRLTARLFDVATGARVDQAEVADRLGPDVRPMFDQLAARLLDLSGAPGEIRTGLAQATTSSLEAFRRYLSGVEHLNRWDLSAAERELRAATALDTTFGLAYYKLALTRGWLVGEEDSIADAAILRATAYSARLPVHERTVINAYRAFLDKDYAGSRSLYRQLIARDSTDADAWYGLGEAWFHDNPRGPQLAHQWSEALRAFKRTLALAPDYALAYDHIGFLLTQAARRGTGLMLMPNDSFTLAQENTHRPAIDSPTQAAATARAQNEAVRVARSWVAAQPTTMRAHGALVDAYLAAGDYQAALSEVARYRTVPTDHPEEPFVEARIRFASGDVERAAATLRTALDSAAPEDFRQYAGTPTVLDDIAAAANVFAYQGDLADAAKAIDFVSRVRQEVYPELGGRMDGPMNEYWRQASLAELYGAVGGPAAALRRIWQSSTEAGRSAPPERRKEIVRAGANAAIGLFTATADTTALVELGALTGEMPGKELRALLALSRQDSTAARRALAEPDTMSGKMGYHYFRRPLAAQAHYMLGDYQKALEILRDFEPATLSSRGFDARWGMLGRVRLLRAQLHEKLGQLAEARQEYRAVLSQWRRADRALEPFVRQAERGLARLGEQG
jgi:serine/threonine-protein kinase